MGCDIHVVLEEKYEGEWVGVHACPYILHVKNTNDSGENYVGWQATCRNYDFFAKLAGVRGKGPEPLGLPEDASALARMKADAWGADGHSHSYCSVREFVQKEMQTWDSEFITAAIRKKFLTGNDGIRRRALELLGVDTNTDEDLDRFRVVFWFDN